MNDPEMTVSQQSSGGTSAPPTGSSMSTAGTLRGIFFEPARTFESLRKRPRFLVAALIIISVTMIFSILAIERVGYENIVRSSIETNPRVASMSPDQKEQIIQSQSGPIFKALNYLMPLILLVISIAAGAALYLLGLILVGKRMSYQQALSVWSYSSLPPTLLLMLVNIVLLFLKSPDEIDIANSRSGLAHANLGVLVDAKSSPILATALGSIDLFGFYGLFLAALGIRKVTRSTTGTAWLVVLTIWVLFVVLRIGVVALLGTPMG